MRVCDATDADVLCATPFDVGLLRGTPAERIARGMYARNRVSRVIPNDLGVDVQVLPMPADIRGSDRAADRWRASVFLRAPAYTRNGQAIVFTKQRAAYGGWMVLERDGTDWMITYSTNIPLY